MTPSARQGLDRMMSEAGFQEAVIQLAELTGWRCMHVRAVTDQRGRTRTPTTTVGWPDVTLWRPDRLMFRELKTEAGRVTVEQRDVLDSLAAAGADVAVWRPSQWDEIETTLRGEQR